MGSKHSALSILVVALNLATGAHALGDSNDQPLDEVVVTATLRSVPLEQTPGSISVLDAQALRDAGQQHFEDVLPLVPNLNWAGDTSVRAIFKSAA